MRVVVTGASGNVGSALVERLAAEPGGAAGREPLLEIQAPLVVEIVDRG